VARQTVPRRPAAGRTLTSAGVMPAAAGPARAEAPRSGPHRRQSATCTAGAGGPRGV